MNAGVHAIGRDGTTSAITHSATAPNTICQAVNDNGDGACSSNMRLLNTVPSAQAKPPATASSELCKLPSPCHGSITQTRPAAASASPSQCRGVGLSLNNHHASNTTQNGMV